MQDLDLWKEALWRLNNMKIMNSIRNQLEIPFEISWKSGYFLWLGCVALMWLLTLFLLFSLQKEEAAGSRSPDSRWPSRHENGIYQDIQYIYIYPIFGQTHTSNRFKSSQRWCFFGVSKWSVSRLRCGNDHAEQLRTKAGDWGNAAIHNFLKTKDIKLECGFDSRLVEVVWLCSCWLWRTCITETFSSSPAFWFVLPSAWRDLTAATAVFLCCNPHELGYNPYNYGEM